MDTSDHGTKSDPKELLSFVYKNFFPPKINQDRVANNVFDLQNDFLEDRLSFPVYGEKINWVILGLFEARRTKSLNSFGR